VFPNVVQRFVRTGTLKVEARPVAFIGPDSVRGLLAALAAARQNRFFNFTELLYFNQGRENSGWLDDGMVKAAAASIPGVNVQKVLATRKSAPIVAEAKRYAADANADRVSGTPTVLIGKTGGKAQQVVPSLDAIAAAVRAASRS
jgi:protein-disulfide isomerase